VAWLTSTVGAEPNDVFVRAGKSWLLPVSLAAQPAMKLNNTTSAMVETVLDIMVSFQSYSMLGTRCLIPDTRRASSIEHRKSIISSNGCPSRLNFQKYFLAISVQINDDFIGRTEHRDKNGEK
jgi:hypothetical protein